MNLWWSHCSINEGSETIEATATKINIDHTFALFSDPWRRKVIADRNGQGMQLVVVTGKHVWHHHDNADELFLG